jgi:hypothetical protein
MLYSLMGDNERFERNLCLILQGGNIFFLWHREVVVKNIATGTLIFVSLASPSDLESHLPAGRQMAGQACRNKRRKHQGQTVINKNSMTQAGRHLSSLSVDGGHSSRSIPMTSVPCNSETYPTDIILRFSFWRNVAPPFCFSLHWLQKETYWCDNKKIRLVIRKKITSKPGKLNPSIQSRDKTHMDVWDWAMGLC